MATDRALLKQAQSGHIGSIGAVDPIGEVGKAHQETFVFELDADATLAERGFRVDKAFRLKSVYFTPTTALAANGTNYITLECKKRDGAGGAAVVAATTNTNTAGANVSLAAFVPAALTLSATDANLSFAVGNVLSVISTETAAPTTPLGTFSVTVEYV